MHFFKKKITRRKFDFTQNLLEIFNSRRTITLNYIQGPRVKFDTFCFTPESRTGYGR